MKVSNKIGLIKLVRATTNLDLKTAKLLVEAILDEAHPEPEIEQQEREEFTAYVLRMRSTLTHLDSTLATVERANRDARHHIINCLALSSDHATIESLLKAHLSVDWILTPLAGARAEMGELLMGNP